MPEFGGVLRGERLSLREFTVDDAGAVHAAYGDPTVTANFGISPFDAASVGGFLDHAARQATARRRTEYLLAVTGPGGDVLGCAHLLRGDHDTAEIGAVLAAERVGRGHSSELGALLFTLGFDLLGLHRIWSAVLPANTAAQRACAKAGMTYEGTLRAHRCYEGAGTTPRSTRSSAPSGPPAAPPCREPVIRRPRPAEPAHHEARRRLRWHVAHPTRGSVPSMRTVGRRSRSPT